MDNSVTTSWELLFFTMNDIYRSLSPWNTLQGINISPKNAILKMIFLFPRWDMLIPWRVSFLTCFRCSSLAKLFHVSRTSTMRCLSSKWRKTWLRCGTGRLGAYLGHILGIPPGVTNIAAWKIPIFPGNVPSTWWMFYRFWHICGGISLAGRKPHWKYLDLPKGQRRPLSPETSSKASQQSYPSNGNMSFFPHQNLGMQTPTHQWHVSRVRLYKFVFPFRLQPWDLPLVGVPTHPVFPKKLRLSGAQNKKSATNGVHLQTLQHDGCKGRGRVELFQEIGRNMSLGLTE